MFKVNKYRLTDDVITEHIICAESMSAAVYSYTGTKALISAAILQKGIETETEPYSPDTPAFPVTTLNIYDLYYPEGARSCIAHSLGEALHFMETEPVLVRLSDAKIEMPTALEPEENT